MEHEHLDPLPACPICHHDSLKPILRVKDHTVSGEDFDLADCYHCGFRATTPRPREARIGRYYESKDYISHTNDSSTLFARAYQAARTIAIKQKTALIQRRHRQGQILDIGSGTGEFLAALKKRAFIVQGVEPSPLARQHALHNHGIQAVEHLDQIPAHEQFSAITMWHVLEHVHQVRNTLKKVHARLKPGGSLLIAVPDRESWDAKHYGHHWAAYDVPRHLSHFRRRDIHILLNEHGFQLVQQRHMWMDALYVSMLSEKQKGHKSLVSSGLGLLMGTFSNLIALLGRRPSSSTLFIAKKR